MFKKNFHPKAYLTQIRNIRPGLATRTKILLALEKEPMDAKTVAEQAEITYGSAIYHLNLLKAEKIVQYTGTRTYVWKLTGAGQKRLTDLET
jgi:predicted transcriptional regulator